MKTVDIIGRLETAFYDLHIYIEGGEVYRYYGFQNAFVLITRLVKDGDDSAELMYRVGRCFKLAEYMNENAMLRRKMMSQRCSNKISTRTSLFELCIMFSCS